MRRGIVIALLSLGALAGFGSGFCHLHHRLHHGGGFEEHVAQICADAALRARAPH
jgi:hypothetical protein